MTCKNCVFFDKYCLMCARLGCHVYEYDQCKNWEEKSDEK